MADSPEAEAIALMHRHAEALNAHNETDLAATLHFPHFRLSGTQLKIWESPERYFSDFRARAGSDWGSSRFEDIQVVDASSDKVHLDVEVRRFDAAGAAITKFRSLWVITRENGIWAAKFRSSFAAL